MHIALLAGCTHGLDDPLFPTGSSTIASDGAALVSVHRWDHTVSRLEGGEIDQLDLDGEPTRIARVGEELWVTLRTARSVAVLRDLDVVDTLRVGAEPYGIVVSEDGTRVYVALSQEDAVLELDAASRDVLRRFPTADDPRWLALHPSGRALFVVSAFDAAITRIDLETGETSRHRPPRTHRPTEHGDVDLTPRPTGDPAVSPHGDALVVPMLYVDNVSPVDEPIDRDGSLRPPKSGAYASGGDAELELSISRMNAALVGFPLDERTGAVLADEPVLPVFVGGLSSRSVVRGYLSSVTFADDGATVLASMEASQAVAIVSLEPFEGQDMRRSRLGVRRTIEDDFVPPSRGGFFERPQHFVRTTEGPDGVAFDDRGRPWVSEAGDRVVARLPLRKAVDVLEGLRAHEVGQVDRDEPVERYDLGLPRLPAEIELGRELFFSATDRRMASRGAGVSCATCHFEGRNDGLTWTFEDGMVRQTPSLAGTVSETAPVTWTRQVAGVADEAMITSQGRMGGKDLQDHEAARIAAFIDFIREVDVARREEALVQLGAEVFQRPEVGCATCHSGPRLTDNGHYDLFGLRGVNTPTLVGIAATAPYLHDGSEPTLRSLLERLREGGMGSTASLTDEELDALLAYLESL